MSILDGLREEGGVLDNIKSRLGFGGDQDGGYSRYGADDDYADDDYDYEDDYTDQLDEEYGGYGSDYDERAPIGAYRPITTSRSSRSTSSSGPRLVSIDDVKTTPIADRSTRDAAATSTSSTFSTSRYGNRTVLDETVPRVSSPAHNVAMRDARPRSEGLDSLFESTAPSTRQSASSGSGYDPYEAYSSSTPSTHAPTRSLTVLKPTSYNDVQRVAKAVKAGDVVVLALRDVSDDLSKRLLDFSFGVASALDAYVEQPASKVIAISRGNALSSAEKSRLRSQGVL